MRRRRGGEGGGEEEETTRGGKRILSPRGLVEAKTTQQEETY